VWIHPRFFSSAELVDRVRWQLEQCLRENSTEYEFPPGVVAVIYRALDPEERTAHEPGLWGSSPDARVHQVFSRVQGLVGAAGVVTAHSQNSRLATDSQVFTPWGDTPASTQPVGPLPGALPKPLPGTVFDAPKAIALRDSADVDIVVQAARLSANPAWMSYAGRRMGVVSWAGPWPVCEKWWDRQQTRFKHRLQVVDERGMGWLLVATDGATWVLEARYD
jgi:protein ImuB